ncbi:MAG: nuclear transport factor 2 family protein [Ignavibacteriae bacterium]|nr:nuclear transport factor 2 family protein [Ignavibacteriota bacterium]
MTNKEIVKDFLTLCAYGKSRDAFKIYVGENFKHHNAYFKGDANSLMIAMEESSKTNPNEIFEIKQILQDGNLVASHSYIKQPNNSEIAVVHILKFNHEKIVEMWDIIHPFPEKITNENGMF